MRWAILAGVGFAGLLLLLMMHSVPWALCILFSVMFAVGAGNVMGRGLD